MSWVYKPINLEFKAGPYTPPPGRQVDLDFSENDDESPMQQAVFAPIQTDALFGLFYIRGTQSFSLQGLNAAGDIGSPTLVNRNRTVSVGGYNAGNVGAPAWANRNRSIVMQGLNAAGNIGTPTISGGQRYVFFTGFDAGHVGSPTLELRHRVVFPLGFNAGAIGPNPTWHLMQRTVAMQGLNAGAFGRFRMSKLEDTDLSNYAILLTM